MPQGWASRHEQRSCDSGYFGGDYQADHLVLEIFSAPGHRGAAHDRLLMKGVGGIGEARGAITVALGPVIVRMKDDVRAAPRRPAHGLRVTKAFVADRERELERACLEDAALRSRFELGIL